MIRRGEDVLGSWRVRPIGFRERHMRGGDYDTGWEAAALEPFRAM